MIVPAWGDQYAFAYASEESGDILAEPPLTLTEVKAGSSIQAPSTAITAAAMPVGTIHVQFRRDNLAMGAGAGGDPTAVAVVSDLMFVAESLATGARPRLPMPLAAPKVSCDFETPWYLRFWVKDQPGIIASLAAILSAHQLNIDAVLQKPGFDKNTLPFVITLEPCRDAQLQPALHEMSVLPFALRPCLCLPILR